MEKIKLAKILIDRWEGPTNRCGERSFASFAAADRHLNDMSREEGGQYLGYWKCGVRIIFEDGYDFTGTRLDVSAGEHQNIALHFKREWSFLAGTWRPAHLTAEVYEKILKRGGFNTPDSKAHYAALLEKYDLSF